jgi:hypothetical protein
MTLVQITSLVFSRLVIVAHVHISKGQIGFACLEVTPKVLFVCLMYLAQFHAALGMVVWFSVLGLCNN